MERALAACVGASPAACGSVAFFGPRAQLATGAATRAGACGTSSNRLAERTGATVLFAWCERSGADLDFALHVEPAPERIANPDPVVATTALNAMVERIARRDPAQYQWTYKRYGARPEGSGEPNPYKEHVPT